MHYQWQEHFEGLLQLAEIFGADADLKLLADHCRLREQGLRRAALAKLEEFLAAAAAFDKATARRAAIKILETGERTEAHGFSHPLTTRFLAPTLQAWMQEDAQANLPVRWLAILRHDFGLLNRALAMCPSDTPIRIRLIDRVLESVRFTMHHIDESVLLGSPEGVLDELATARRLIAESPDPAALARLTAQVDYFAQLIADWQAWSVHRTGTFPQWCAGQGRSYHFSVKYYYES